MEKEQFEALKSLVLEVFSAAGDYVEKRAFEAEPDILQKDVHALLVEEFPILRFTEAEDIGALVEELVAGGMLPANGETEDFFLHILDRLNGSNRSHAYNDAVMALNTLSQGYKKLAGLSADLQ